MNISLFILANIDINDTMINMRIEQDHPTQFSMKDLLKGVHSWGELHESLRGELGEADSVPVLGVSLA